MRPEMSILVGVRRFPIGLDLHATVTESVNNSIKERKGPVFLFLQGKFDVPILSVDVLCTFDNVRWFTNTECIIYISLPYEDEEQSLKPAFQKKNPCLRWPPVGSRGCPSHFHLFVGKIFPGKQNMSCLGKSLVTGWRLQSLSFPLPRFSTSRPVQANL